MKTTRNRKVKRGKTRRTRRKTRTVHRGGIKWWWQKNNEVAPEPTIELFQVKDFLSKNNYPDTFQCLSNEIEIQRKGNPQSVAEVKTHAQSAQSAESNILWTKEKPNPNGWYIERDRDIIAIINAKLTNMSGDLGNINNYSNSNFEKYMNTINNLPNPSYSYSTDIDGVIHTLSLRSNDGGGHLLWVDSKNNNITYDYNTAKPLTISINGKECTLTKV